MEEPKNILLREQAYQSLKTLIVEGDFPPGTFLSERQLALKLGMSKTPVRTALERLAMERFVVISPQQGILVRELSLQEINDHYDIRLALETFVVQRLAERATRPQIDALENNIEQMRGVVRAADKRGFVRMDTEFHVMMCDFLGNQEITRVMQHQRDKLYRVAMHVTERNPSRMPDTVKEHSAIVEALSRGDRAAAVASLQSHLNNGRNLLVLS